MARKTSSKPPSNSAGDNRQPLSVPDKAEWGGFINIRLSDDQREEFFAWYEQNPVGATAMLEDLLGAGAKVTFSFDAQHECYIVSVTGALLADSPGVRFVSTSRASTMMEVVALTVWKHFLLVRGDYGKYRPRDDSFMRWG